MKCDLTTIFVLILLVCSVQYASSILCYDCNSKYDPSCGENFETFSLGIVNCSLRDPPEHIDYIEPNICRAIKMEMPGEIRIVRSCGYIPDDETNHTCKRVSGGGNLFVTYCSCYTDLCNSGLRLKIQNVVLGVLIAVSVFSIMLFL